MPQKIGNDQYYSAEEVAVCANEDYRTSLKKINDGLIDSIVVQRKKLVSRSALIDYMESLNLPEDVIDYRLGLKSPKPERI